MLLGCYITGKIKSIRNFSRIVSRWGIWPYHTAERRVRIRKFSINLYWVLCFANENAHLLSMITTDRSSQLAKLHTQMYFLSLVTFVEDLRHLEYACKPANHIKLQKFMNIFFLELCYISTANFPCLHSPIFLMSLPWQGEYLGGIRR